MYSPRTGGRYNGLRPSKKAVVSISDAIRKRLWPGNHSPWEDVVRALTAPCGPGATTAPTARLRKHGTMWDSTCTTPSAAFYAGPAQDCRVWPSAVSHACGRWGTGGVVSPLTFWRPPLRMPSRETRPRAGWPRWSTSGSMSGDGETQRWPSRRERPRKTSLAVGAAGPLRHRALPRLDPTLAGS